MLTKKDLELLKAVKVEQFLSVVKKQELHQVFERSFDDEIRRHPFAKQWSIYFPRHDISVALNILGLNEVMQEEVEAILLVLWGEWVLGHLRRASMDITTDFKEGHTLIGVRFL
jgi:hypothetical protein